MPRVHFVKKARKDNSAVSKGESYYWWKFNFGPMMRSKTQPRRSQLTRSPFLSTLWDLEDGIGSEMDEDAANDLIASLHELKDECQDSLDNMPYHLQDTSESGMLLQERVDALDGWIIDIENIDWNHTSEEEAADQISEGNPEIG